MYNTYITFINSMMTQHMKKIALYTTTALTALLPVAAFAQFGEVNDFFQKILVFINNTLVPLIFALALLMFLWGVFKFFILGGDDDSRQDGKKFMIWGILAFVMMVSVWGIVNALAGGLGFSKDENIQNIPNIPTNNR